MGQFKEKMAQLKKSDTKKMIEKQLSKDTGEESDDQSLNMNNEQEWKG